MSNKASANPFTAHEDNEDEEEGEEEDEEDEEPTVRRRTIPKRSQPPVSDGATTYLEQQSKEELVALLKTLMRQHPDVRQAIVDRANLLSGEVKKIVATARKEIYSLSRMSTWGDEDDWGQGSGGNYPRLRTHLEALLASGHADEVLSLGQELFKAGTQQVEMTDNEGETAGEIITCMNIVRGSKQRASSRRVLLPSYASPSANDGNRKRIGRRLQPITLRIFLITQVHGR